MSSALKRFWNPKGEHHSLIYLLYIGLQDLSSAAKMHLTESEDTDP